MTESAQQSPVARRLSAYWKMEAGNVLLVPAIMIFLAKGNLGWASAAAIVPMMVLLAIGAAYWRAKHRQLVEPGFRVEPTLHWIAALRPFALVLTTVSLVPAFGVWLVPSWAVGLGDKICASLAATLAVLEYINYYHRQLQHFDNAADFKRLLAGRGFRRSQMARDLDRLAK